MAHKFRVELSTVLNSYNGQRSYAFLADDIEWRGGNSLYVTFGQAKWTIRDVVRCVNVTTGQPFLEPERVKEAKAQKGTNISKAERELLYRMLYCHVTSGVVRECGFQPLLRRLQEEFGTDVVDSLTVNGKDIRVLSQQ